MDPQCIRRSAEDEEERTYHDVCIKDFFSILLTPRKIGVELGLLSKFSDFSL